MFWDCKYKKSCLYKNRICLHKKRFFSCKENKRKEKLFFQPQVVLTIFDFAWNEYTRDAYTLSLVPWYWQICQVMKFQDKRISFYRTYLCLGIRLWKQVSAKRVHTWCIYAQSAGSLILAHVSGYEVSRQKVFFYINV